MGKLIAVFGDPAGGIAHAILQAQATGILPEGVRLLNVTEPAALGAGSGVPLPPGSFDPPKDDFLEGKKPWVPPEPGQEVW